MPNSRPPDAGAGAGASGFDAASEASAFDRSADRVCDVQPGRASTASRTSVALTVTRLSANRLTHALPHRRGPRAPALVQHRREGDDADRDHHEGQLQNEDRQPCKVRARAPEVRDLADADA